jgi:small-conductance mechanosensitive channel
LTGRGLAQAADAGEDTVQRILRAQDQLAAVSRAIERETLLAAQGSLPEREDRNRLLARLRENKSIHQRLLNALKKNMSLANEAAELRQAMENGQAFAMSEKKPYALSYYDGLLDEQAALIRKQAMRDNARQQAENALQGARQALEAAEQRWRRIGEQITEEDDPAYLLARQQRECAAADLALARARAEALDREGQVTQLRVQAVARKQTAARRDLAVDPAVLERRLADLHRQKIRWDERLQSLLEDQRKSELAWTREPTPAGGIAASRARQARQAWRETYERSLQYSEDIAELLQSQEKLWQVRFALLGGAVSTQNMDRWKKENDAIRQRVEQGITVCQSWQLGLRTRMAPLEKERREGDVSARHYVADHLAACRKAAEFGEAYLATLLATGRLSSRLTNEIAKHAASVPVWEKLLAGVKKFPDIWHLELAVIDGNGVTIRKLVTALVILIVGLVLVKYARRLLARRLRKARMDVSAALALEKTLLYLGFLLVVLFALHTVNIPLTAFTFLGGAVAIGFGFGAQNLINNFISGFIIMAERPIRVGDLIELEGNWARVEEVGARCTRIKTAENIHMLVPNSNFLEKHITNWTLSDKMILAKVKVGVAYGSPVDLVTELLLKAVSQSDGVLSEPRPFVLFEDFGDNALMFEIYFGMVVENILQKRRIASNVRYRINALFEQHGIVIAFPQRDVHLDAAGPVQVQLLQPNGQAPTKQV